MNENEIEGISSTLENLNASSDFLNMSTVSVKVNNLTSKALLDSGCFDNIIDEQFFCQLGSFMEVKAESVPEIEVRMAHSKSRVKLDRCCHCDVMLNDTLYSNVRFIIMPSVYDIILGIPFFKLRKNVIFRSNGELPSLKIGFLSCIKTLKPVSPLY